MKYRVFENPVEFYDYALPFLLKNEAENNLILGLAHEVKNPHSRYTDYYLASVEDHAGQILAILFRTPPHNLLLSHLTTTKSDAVLQFIAKQAKAEFGQLPGVIGSMPFAEDFAKLWKDLTGQDYHMHMSQRIYALTEVVFPQGIAGNMRAIVEEDRPVLQTWFRDFMIDAMDEEPPAEETQKQVERRFVGGDDVGLVIWEVAGEPVSMAGFSGPTPNGIRVNAVYTPPDQRRKGYATACVAELSQMLLDKGHTLCFLYTDLSNPTSNSIYQKIGYRPVCDAAHISFAEA